VSLNNFGDGGSILTKLFRMTYHVAGVIMWVQVLEGLPPKIWEGKKNVKISARFLRTFDFDREYLRNGTTFRKSEKKLDQEQPLPCLAKQIW